jgi:hypothetical protein
VKRAGVSLCAFRVISAASLAGSFARYSRT